MADLNTLYSQRQQYVSLKSEVLELASSLGNVASSLTPANNSIENGYRIDEVRADNKEINQIYLDISERKNTLNGSVSAAIDGEISRIDAEIRAEEERLRQEEEARKKAEEAERLALLDSLK